MPIGDDVTQWSYWWEFHKDPFLRLRNAVHTADVLRDSDDFHMGIARRVGVDSMPPTRADVLKLALPALHHALRDPNSQRDITSASLIALAKIGLDGEGESQRLVDTLATRLVSADQEIRETAAVSLGISGRPEAAPLLLHLVADDEEGRRLVDRSSVDARTRSFACYGLGLLAWSADPVIQEQAADALIEVLAERPIRILEVAAINALGLLRPSDDHRGDVVRREALFALERAWLEPRGAGDQLIQSHVPVAVAALLEGATKSKAGQRWKRSFADALRPEKEQRAHIARRQSIVIALGRMCEPNVPGGPDADIHAALFQTWASARDDQTAYFAAMALAEAGGAENRDLLLRALASGQKAIQKPWAAVALGVYERQRQDALVGLKPSPDMEVCRAILAVFEDVRNPGTLAACAIGAGLARAPGLGERVRPLLRESHHQEELAGYLCIALSLAGDRRSVPAVRDVFDHATRRPRLLLQASMALGRLGDKRAASILEQQMRVSGRNVAIIGSIASAIGQIGDRRSLGGLSAMLNDPSLSDLNRAFAAVALGGIADKEAEPWNAKIARNVNYRASVETLTNGMSGVLDIF